MAQVKLHETLGHTAYLLGHESRTGWWYYFPVALFFKSPLPFLILALWSAATQVAALPHALRPPQCLCVSVVQLD